MLHTFAIYVDNKPGVLNRVSSLFRRRAFNIDSLTVGHTETAGVSRMTIVCDCDPANARRVEANIYKLVDVLRVDDITEHPSVERDGHDIAKPDHAARCHDPHAIDPYMTGGHQIGGGASGAHHAGVPQPFVDALAIHAKRRLSP